MNQPESPVVEQCVPDHCLEILRAFSGTNNGEATVILVLRHIAQLAETSRAAIVFPQAAPRTKRTFIAIGGYEPLRRHNAGDGTGCFEIRLEKNGMELGLLRFLDEKGKFL